jgi:histidinol-phosphate aminotransferase
VLERVARTIAERISVDERLRALGLRVAESQANFCWVHVGEQREEQTVMRVLQERGVLVRGGAALGREGALRVTFGTSEENVRFLAALEEALEVCYKSI